MKTIIFSLLALIIYVSPLHAQWKKMGDLSGYYYNLAASNNKLIAYHPNSNDAYISEDTGRVWQKMTTQSILPNQNFAFYIQGNNIFNIRSIGVIVSKDNGNSWTLTASPHPNAKNISLVIDNSDVYLIAGIQESTVSYNIYKFNATSNGWDIQNFFPTNTISIGFSVNKMYALTTTDFYVSKRNTVSWVKNTPPFTPYISLDGDGNGIPIVASDSAIVMNYGVLYTSQTDGKTWKQYTADDNRAFQYVLVKDNIFYLKKSGQVSYSTDNASTWFVLNNGWNNDSRFNAGQMNKGIALMGNTLIASTQSIVNSERGTGLMRMNITEKIWKNLPLSPLSYTNIINLFRSGNALFAVTYYGLFYTSTDNGITWTPLGKLPIKTEDTFAGQNSVISKDSFILFYGSLHPFDGFNDSTYMVRSSNFGKTWVKDDKMKSFNSFYFQNDTLFLGTNDGVFKSPKPYTSFIQVYNKPVKNSMLINENVVIALNGSDSIVRMDKNGNLLPKTLLYKPFQITDMILHKNKIIVSAIDSIYISSDNALTWQSKIISGAYQLAYLLSADSLLLAVDNNNKVFISKNNGDTWSESSVGIPASTTQSINFKCGHFVDNSYFYINLNELGIYRRAVKEFYPTGIHELLSKENNIYNIQVSPNPVLNDFRFEMPQNLEIGDYSMDIRIIDLTGRVVYSQKKAFERFNTITSLSLQSGYYILKVEVGGKYFSGVFVK